MIPTFTWSCALTAPANKALAAVARSSRFMMVSLKVLSGLFGLAGAFGG
jgi:hypothetical protein